ncbi:MAG: hypothetical protein RL531_185, partial [Actinomycetota bacterium]
DRVDQHGNRRRVVEIHEQLERLEPRSGHLNARGRTRQPFRFGQDVACAEDGVLDRDEHIAELPSVHLGQICSIRSGHLDGPSRKGEARVDAALEVRPRA